MKPTVKTASDEIALIAELQATFPGSRPVSLRTWQGHTDSIGVVVCGEAEVAPGQPIGPYRYVDMPEYNGLIHTGFEAWLEARGWYAEVYEYGTLWILPLPSQQELDEWRAECDAINKEYAQRGALQADDGAPF